MMPQRTTAVVLALGWLGFAAAPGIAAAAGPALWVEKPRCEYLADPEGLEVRQPRLSWTLGSVQRGQRQTAYEVLAASTPAALTPNQADLWRSGKVASDQTLHIVYGGAPLASRQRVWWKARAWDKDGEPSAWSAPARWTMGLLEPGDWQARWIAHPAPVPSALPARNGYHSEMTNTADALKWVTLDLGRAVPVEAVRLYPARPANWQPDTPGFLFPLRFRVEVAETAGFERPMVIVDQTQADVPAPGTNAPVFSCPPTAGRYVRLAVTRLRLRDLGHYGFALAELEVLAGGRNVAVGAAVKALDTIETAGWATAFLTDGDLASHGASRPEAQPATLLRKTFDLTGRVRRATLYASALGVYQFRVNGRSVGDHVLPPEWTDYHTRVQYQAYDVTGLVRKGENVLGAVVGDGWYAGRLGMSDGLIGVLRGVYGAKPSLLAQLELELTDGQTVKVVTDPSWVGSKDGPIRSSDLLDGEVYDARRELAGWDVPGFTAADWQPVEMMALASARLVAQPNEPIRVIQELKPIALTEPKPGVYVFDLGQNMVGRCRFDLTAPAGTTIRVRHGESTNADGGLYTANLRGAPQVDTYTFGGASRQPYEAAFTQHGFRFVEVAGLPQRPASDAVVGRVFTSAAPPVGAFACSDPLLKKLWENILWTQRANLMSVPTDCPQRDERLGWMGDIQAFSQTAIFNLDMAAFFTKWTRDIRDAQADNGCYADFSPHPYGRNERFTGVPAWGDAGTIVPWRAYVNYADTRLLEEHFNSATRWIEYIRGENPDLLWRKGRHNDYNDWLNGDTLRQTGWPTQGGMVPQEVFATAFFAHSTELVARMAAALGRAAEAQEYGELFAEIKRAFNAAFVQPDGRLRGDTQAGYALALNFNLLPEPLRETAARHLVEGLRRYSNHVSTGIQSTHRLMLELPRWGYEGLAWQLLTNRTFPSWGYMIENGATTIWERWDGYVKGRGFQDPGMNSLNHWALGSVGEWLYRHILGINADEAHPGYAHFVLRPRPGGGVTWAKGHYDSVRGRIASAWSIGGGKLTVKLGIPVNTTATAYVPAQDPGQVREIAGRGRRGPGARRLRTEPGAAVFEVGSGEYEFVAPWAQ